MPTISSKRKPAHTTTIRIPATLRSRLGAAPADTLTELLALRRAIGNVTPKELAANPFLHVTLDATRKTQPFATSSIRDLRDWVGTERELLNQAISVSGLGPEAIARAGVLRQAAIEIQNDYRRAHAPADGPKRGVAGNRDDELRDSVNGYFKTLGRVSASSLRTKTGVPFRACLRFLERHAAALGLHLHSDRRTYTWTPPPADDPTSTSDQPGAATKTNATNGTASATLATSLTTKRERDEEPRPRNSRTNVRRSATDA